MRPPALFLAGAATAAVLLLIAGAVVAVVQDDEIRDCIAILAALRTANGTHQDALQALDRAEHRAQRDGEQGAGVPTATLLAKQAGRDLDAARAEFRLLCHYVDGQAEAK